MLWLAGLFCIAGVGAASFVSLPADEDESDLEPEADDGNMAELDDSEDLFAQMNAPHSTDGHDVTTTMQQNDLDVLNTVKTDPTQAFDGTDGIYDLNAARPVSDSDLLPETPHALSLLGPNAAVDDDYWAFDSETGDDIAIAEAPTIEDDTQASPALGDWIQHGAPSEVLDYQHSEESLMLVWDDLETDAPPPEVDVASDPFDDEVKHVLMNGKSVAEVYGDPNMTAADVTVIPLSSALIVGLEPA